ncbi:sugar diacid recognition domain-containing protein [Vibrio hippocampi]|uniref:Carbohydrate diacid regulator n=1 Tax=Vibrio hippocampi TaxID=654686 RepID=A0ABM8ZJM7_9VIBR|nr:sugar diacid recognition domain-containing protein [Vibrio hippocampi]CAH0526913.1 Carbohydrate diacid regulator [Vibrio hippocampi]
MQLNDLIAKQIVERAQKIIQHSINVMDERGVIIGSSDPTRLHTPHEGALLAINNNRTVEITESVALTLAGVKQGINLPIIFSDQVIGVVGISGPPDEVQRYGELVKMTAELIVEQAALMAQVQWDKRHREELLLQLIHGTRLTEAQLMSVAARLNLDLSQPRIAAVIRVIPKSGQDVQQEHLQKLIHLLEYPERDNIVGLLSMSVNQVVVLKPITFHQGSWNRNEERKRIQKLLKRVKTECEFSVQIAVGEYYPGVSGLARSFETANATLEYNQDANHPVLFYSEHKLSVLIQTIKADHWRLTELTAPIKKLYQVDDKGVLIKTLRCYFEQNCDLAHTCQKLHIHRNTLRYRLEKIEQITSLSINNLDDKIQLYLALKSNSSLH